MFEQKPLSGTFKWHRRSKPEMKAVWSVVQDLFPEFIALEKAAVTADAGSPSGTAPAASPTPVPATATEKPALEFAIRPLHLLQIVRGCVAISRAVLVSVASTFSCGFSARNRRSVSRYLTSRP